MTQIYDVTLAGLVPKTEVLHIEASSPQHAVAIAREVMPSKTWNLVAVDDLDIIDTCSRCGLTLFDGDFAMKVHGLVYCEDCMPETMDVVMPEPEPLTWFEWIGYRWDCVKVWFAGRA